MPALARPLTDKKIDASKPKATIYRLSDGNGLHLEIRPSGLKTWLVRYRLLDGTQPAAIAIGHYPPETPLTGLSLAQARSEAAKVINAAKAGQQVKGLNTQKRERRQAIEVSNDAAAQAAAAASQFSFRVIAEKWISEKKPHWQLETYRKARLVLDSYLTPALGDYDMRTLVTKDVKPVLLEMHNKVPLLAKKARQHLNGIVSCAIDEGMRADDQILRLGGILPKHQGGHVPAIVENESDLKRLMKAINAYSSPIIRAALWLTSLTALRPGSVVPAEWREIDWGEAEWRVPGKKPDGTDRMKGGRPFSTSLSTQALELLKEMQAISGRGVYVFPAIAKQKTPHVHRDSLGSALRRLGFQGEHTAHGFRATLRTIGREKMNIDIDVLENQLAHLPQDQVAAAYARGRLKNQRREVMQAWADYLDSLVAG
ncbi:tyrosine-type recombinase/integrase [Dyella sp. 20L07]|uniref:tyrosine-type recombinase/integrase n=1 Tax=Dyella sp. 20L07 TaxID=3384240 RepID=UPI003D296180